jgi:NAD(P)-dependent dehydrogenase (short-subunit alcohol dehydrogenase family)
MYPDLKERVVILTGASRGIGQGIATAFGEEGSTVIGIDRLDCAETGEMVRAQGGNWGHYQLDLTEPSAIADAVADIAAKHGRIDILVNNAGILNAMPFEELDLATWNQYFAINATSHFLMAKAVIPHMKARKFGRIIGLASGILLTPAPFYAAYMATKNAVIGLTRGLATEMGEFGITVNAVSPSYVTSPGQIEVGSTHIQPLVTSQQAIKRDCVPADLAPLVTFLASDGARFITGQTMHADGGLTYK